MLPTKRLVLDVNVLVSAVLSDAGARAAVRHATATSSIVVSLAIIAEYHAVLARSKFDRYASLKTRLELLNETLRLPCLELVQPDERVRACRDPGDDKYLEAALAGRARIIVSGDADLLTLDPWRGVRILRPGAYLGEANAN